MVDNNEQSIKIKNVAGSEMSPSGWLTGDVLTDDELPLMDEGRSMEDLSEIDSTIKVKCSEDLPTKHMESDGNLQEKMKATIDELDEFLIKNESIKDEHIDDGNDTDELLRMLGEDGTAPKKHVLKKKAENDKMNDSDEDDMSKVVGKRSDARSSNINKRMRHATNGHRNHNESSAEETKNKVICKIININKDNNKCTTVRDLKRQLMLKERKVDSCDEEINEAEFLEEDGFDLDDKLAQSDVDSVSDDEQVLCKPEGMDEEMLSDGETDDEDNGDDYSFYGGLPSSDSENVDEWFDLDLRSEQAGEYLPLLGEDAEELLLTEKDNVRHKINALKLSLNDVTRQISVRAKNLEKKRQRLVRLDALLSQF